MEENSRQVTRRRWPMILAGNALVRIAGGAGSVSIGLYFADQASRGQDVSPALVAGTTHIRTSGRSHGSICEQAALHFRSRRGRNVAVVRVSSGHQHCGHAARLGLLLLIEAAVMVESGLTPAALVLLADVVGGMAGRGAAMGIYSALLGVGALLGALLGRLWGARFGVDGLILGISALGVAALLTVQNLPAPRVRAA